MRGRWWHGLWLIAALCVLGAPSDPGDGGAPVAAAASGTPRRRLPGAPAPRLLSATAADTGRNVGAAAGDSLWLRFDQPVARVPMGSRALVDAVLATSVPLGADYVGGWAAADTLVVNVTATLLVAPLSLGALAARARDMAVGTLGVRVLAGGGLVAAGGGTLPCNASAAVGAGSWGDAPADVTLVPVGPGTVAVLVDAPASNPLFPSAWYRVRHGPAGAPPTASLLVPSAGATTVVLLRGLAPVALAVDVAASNADPLSVGEPFPGVVGAALGPPVAAAPAGFVPLAAPAVASVEVRSESGRLDTRGGQQIVVCGRGMGDWGSNVTVLYGPWRSAGCAVAVQWACAACTASPGVGRDLRITVCVDASCALTAFNVSYEAPAVSRVALVAPRLLAFAGDHFGGAGTPVTVVAEYGGGGGCGAGVSAACNVSTPFVQALCVLPADVNVVGVREWRLAIAGATSAFQPFEFLRPRVAAVLVPHGAPSTSGGGSVLLQGELFGCAAGCRAAAVLTSRRGGRVVLQNCTITVAFSEMSCAVPPGAGAAYQVSVSCDMSSWSALSNATLAYGAPNVTDTSPRALPSAGGAVTLLGENLGDASTVAVSAGGIPCNVAVTVPGLVLVVVVPAGAVTDPVIVTVDVGGAMLRISIPVLPPQVIAFEAVALTESIFRLIISGFSFGLLNSTTVSVGGVPCAVENVTASKITCVSSMGAGPVVVSAGARRTGLIPFNVSSVFATPNISSVSPLSGPAAGGTVVTIRGGGFGAASSWGAVIIAPAHAAARGSVPWMPVCDVVRDMYTDSSVQCVMSAGTGVGYSFAVERFLVRSPPSSQLFAFEAPSVSAVAPSVCSSLGCVISVSGSSFGPSAGAVLLGAQSCAPVLSWSDSLAVCVAPPGLQSGISVTVVVGGQRSVNAVYMSYKAPVVMSISRSSGPPSGGYLIAVCGSDFGPHPLVQFVVHNLTKPCVLVLDGWNASCVNCVVPPLWGLASVVVQSGFQSSGAAVGVAQPVFSFTGPLLNAVDSAGMPRPAAGGFVAYAHGFGFTQEASVLAGGTRCKVLSISDVRVEFVAPPRSNVNGRFWAAGAAVVSVSAFGQVSEEIRLQYDMPRVLVLLPDFVPATPRQGVSSRVNVTGCDFGSFNATSISVAFGPAACVPVDFGVDFVHCLFSETVGFGPLPVRVTLGDLATDAIDVLSAVCTTGQYRAQSGMCNACPHGAQCAGLSVPPLSAQGFYEVAAGLFVTCSTSGACMGNNTCSMGYGAERCSVCLPGFYRFGRDCLQCGNWVWLSQLAIIVFLIVLVVTVMALNAMSVNLTGFRLGIEFLQLAALFTQIDLAWPESVQSLWRYVTLFNFNLQMFSPECTAGSALGYARLWYMLHGLPIVIGCTMCVLLGLLYLAALHGSGCDTTTPLLPSQRGALKVVRDNLVGVSVTLFWYLYVGIFVSSMDAFDCTAGGAVSAMLADPTILCQNAGDIVGPGNPGSGLPLVYAVSADAAARYNELRITGIIALVVYGAGFPAWYIAVFRRHREAFRQDQKYMILEEGIARDTSVHICLRRRASRRARGRVCVCVAAVRVPTLVLGYARLYEDFKTSARAWGVVQLLRKASLAYFARMFSQNPMFQAAGCICVLFISYALTTHFRPFVAAATVQKLWDQKLREHKDPDRADVANFEKKIQRYKLINYNSVENAFIVSTALLLLGGMCFASGSLSPVLRGLLTALVFTIAVVSMCVLVGITVLEWYTVRNDNRERRRSSARAFGGRGHHTADPRDDLNVHSLRGWWYRLRGEVRDHAGVEELMRRHSLERRAGQVSLELNPLHATKALRREASAAREAGGSSQEWVDARNPEVRAAAARAGGAPAGAPPLPGMESRRRVLVERMRGGSARGGGGGGDGGMHNRMGGGGGARAEEAGARDGEAGGGVRGSGDGEDGSGGGGGTPRSPDAAADAPAPAPAEAARESGAPPAPAPAPTAANSDRGRRRGVQLS